jgi:valyl-tRNA synthetase
VIEPFLTEQWYVRAEVLARPALQAVTDGVTRFVPEQWKNTYFSWLREIQPWCISRQLWWGHQIPAWYDESGTFYVAETEEDARKQAGPGGVLTQDPDVLDTWFSSALWPFSTLGWPDTAAEDLKRYYPGAVLVTGFDIIFFWVARMMMMGMYFQADALGFAGKIRVGEALEPAEMAEVIPFHDVYIHALVRDKHGQKMSKSKGNVIDPLELIDQYGTDALRFTLAVMAAQGRDVKLDPTRIEGYRNFATKLWNAARFGEMNDCFNPLSPAAATPSGSPFDPMHLAHPVNRWCVAELAVCAEAVGAALESYKFNEASETLYHFVWGTFCDWYVEFTKPLFSADAATIAETRATFAWAFSQLAHLLHPFMPFITDELAEKLGFADGPLTLGSWPALGALAQTYPDSRRELALVIDAINAVRSARTEVNVPVAAKLTAFVETTDDASEQSILQSHTALIARMARLSALRFGEPVPVERALQVVVGSLTLFLPLEGIIDFEAEAARLMKAREKLDKELTSLEGRLSNPGFLAKAPEAVVAEGRERIAELQQKKENLERSLKRLQAA